MACRRICRHQQNVNVQREIKGFHLEVSSCLLFDPNGTAGVSPAMSEARNGQCLDRAVCEPRDFLSRLLQRPLAPCLNIPRHRQSYFYATHLQRFRPVLNFFLAF
jgi:hypothetical protein